MQAFIPWELQPTSLRAALLFFPEQRCAQVLEGKHILYPSLINWNIK
jgi:hypothetical protein